MEGRKKSQQGAGSFAAVSVGRRRLYIDGSLVEFGHEERPHLLDNNLHDRCTSDR